MKKALNVFGFFAFFLFPILLFFLVVSTHSNALIGGTLQIVVALLCGLCLGYIVIYGILSKGFKKSFRKVILIILIVLSFLGSITLGMLFYGPIKTFSEWYIITGMDTMSHNYLVKWFYNDDEIDKVYKINYIVEVDEDQDEELINTETKVYSNDVLEELDSVIKNDTNGILVDDERYCVISMTVNGQQAYVALAYDPSKVILGHTNQSVGQYVTKQAQRYGALLAVNGGGFHDPGANSSGGNPLGLTISEGEVISRDKSSSRYNGGLIGLNNENKMVLIKKINASEALEQGIRDACVWGPFLVVNGKSLYVSGNGGYGTSARTAMGQREDGTIIFLVVDSSSRRTKGATMKQLADIMLKFGAVNAANLDGGTSSVIVAPENIALQCNPNAKHDKSKSTYMIINDPIDSTFAHKTRPIATSWLIMP